MKTGWSTPTRLRVSGIFVYIFRSSSSPDFPVTDGSDATACVENPASTPSLSTADRAIPVGQRTSTKTSSPAGFFSAPSVRASIPPMAAISSAAVALILVFVFVLLGIAAELTYVLWYRRRFRRGPLFAAGDQEASAAGGDPFGTPDSKEVLLYHVLSRGHQSRSERAPPAGEPFYSVPAAIGFAWPGSDSPYYSQAAAPSPSPPWHGGVFYGGLDGAAVAEKEKEGFSPGKVWEEEQKAAAAVKKEQKPPPAVKKEQKPPPAVKKEQKPPPAVKKEQRAAAPRRKEEEEVVEEEGKEQVVIEEEERSSFKIAQMETSKPSTPFYTPTPSPPRPSASDWDLGGYLAELDDEALAPPPERLLRRPKIPK